MLHNSVILLACLIVVVTSQTPKAWFNGINIPWNQFGYDIGSAYNYGWFETFFQACQANHINSARFWLHCDGRASPTFNSNGDVTGLPSTFISDLTNLTTLAKSYDVLLMITLWSFDMCKQEIANGFHPDLISDQSKTQSYITNALMPILHALNGFDNVVYEVINEPEWCIKETPGTTPTMVPLVQMQRFVGMIASAIQKNSPHKVTVGSASLKWDSNTNPPAAGNWWSDAAIGQGYPGGRLNFYQIHYYDWMYNPDWGYDPCREPASYWALDKPTVVGELPVDGGAHYTPLQLLECSYNHSFVGDLFWSYAQGNWRAAIQGWNTFYEEHTDISSETTLINWLKTLQ